MTVPTPDIQKDIQPRIDADGVGWCSRGACEQCRGDEPWQQCVCDRTKDGFTRYITGNQLCLPYQRQQAARLQVLEALTERADKLLSPFFQACEYNYCDEENECWEDCCDVAREMFRETYPELRRLLTDVAKARPSTGASTGAGGARCAR